LPTFVALWCLLHSTGHPCALTLDAPWHMRLRSRDPSRIRKHYSHMGLAYQGLISRYLWKLLFPRDSWIAANARPSAFMRASQRVTSSHVRKVGRRTCDPGQSSAAALTSPGPGNAFHGSPLASQRAHRSTSIASACAARFLALLADLLLAALTFGHLYSALRIRPLAGLVATRASAHGCGQRHMIWPARLHSTGGLPWYEWLLS